MRVWRKRRRNGAVEPSASENEADGRQRRRRRRRRGRGGDREGSGIAANAPQPPDDALAAMAQIGGLRPSAALESEAETGQAPFPGNDETEASHQDARGHSRRGGRTPREASGHHVAEPVDAAELEFKLQPDTSGGDMGENGAGKARRGRRVPPRAPRVRRGRETASEPNVAAAFVPNDQEVQGQAVAPHGDETKGPPASANAGVPETPQSKPADVDAAPDRAELPSRLEEAPQTAALDPARPKRSGWWQRARASLRG